MTGAETSMEAASGPAKTIVEYHVRPGREADFDSWTRQTIEAAGRIARLEGSTVLTSSAAGTSFLLLRFAGKDDLARWESSPESVGLRREAESLADGASAQVREGLATWFTLPEHRTAADPPRWKFALVTWGALFPQIVALYYAFRPLDLPPLVNQAVSSALCVASLTWIAMPFLTRRLHRWLVAR